MLFFYVVFFCLKAQATGNIAALQLHGSGTDPELKLLSVSFPLCVGCAQGYPVFSRILKNSVR